MMLFNQLTHYGWSKHKPLVNGPKCACTSPLGGYCKIWASDECNCIQITSGLIACNYTIQCNDSSQLKTELKDLSLGNKQKWNKLAEYLKNLNDPSWSPIAREIAELYTDDYRTLKSGDWQRIKELNEIFDSASANMAIEIIKLLQE